VRVLLAVMAVAAAGAPGGLSDVRAPGLQVDLRYATSGNLTGAPLPGYRCRRRALLRPAAARALERVQRDLRRRGLGLRVFDAYRPVRATNALVAWAQRTGRDDLIRDGYIARRSNHNRGLAVDLTLVRRSTGRALDMGTRYDALTPRAHVHNAHGAALRNRLTLVAAMTRRGFRSYVREWWHFDFPTRRAVGRLDVPIRC
jgi:D-alanyl-D-alanine dipeptidase